MALPTCPTLPSAASRENRFRQGCFVCLDSPEGGQYAVQVPCARPTNEEWTENMLRTDDGTKSMASYQKTKRLNTAYESDSDIWRRLVKTCYEHKGKWKKWIPFYGVTEVREVTFHIFDVVNSEKRCPIYIMPVDCQTVRGRCEAEWAESWRNSPCEDGRHSDDCLHPMDKFDKKRVFV
ncbi:hypothetical protein F4678DRAFT_363418 [Xylaria arbuscula]|nr:hypothetical protein F4678DRAFT_363418 [Xylaria arbuscula]